MGNVIGAEFACAVCGKTVIRRHSTHKYCSDCAVEVENKRNHDRYIRAKERGIVVIGKELTCALCGCKTVRKASNQKVCPGCREEWHKQQSVIYGKKKRERQKAERENKQPEKVEEVKPFTLSEVAAAARKNKMSYGYYVCAWRRGEVATPDRFTPKKKRGRKKKDAC